MKRKSPGCAENPRRGPGSSGARTFLLPVLCHHFSTPDLGAVQHGRKTHAYALVSPFAPETQRAAPRRSPSTTSGTTGGERDGRGWHRAGHGQHPSAASAERRKDIARWSLLSCQRKAEWVFVAGFPECLFLAKSIPLPPPLNCCGGSPWAEFPAVEICLLLGKH